jgi:hypothetical protein
MRRWVVGLALSTLAAALPAQVTVPVPPAGDTTSLAFDEVVRPRWRQTLVLRGTERRYTVDEKSGTDYGIREQVGGAMYTLRGERLSVRLELAPLRYQATAQSAPPRTTSVAGLTPIGGRVEWRWRDADTTRVYVRSGTRPATLDTAQSRAIGAAGTSTLDLEAGAFGAQTILGVRHVARVLTRDHVSIGLRSAIELSPTPAGSDFTYWTGTTVRAGGVVEWRPGADGRVRAGVDVSRAFANDLGGRNLFPGGGSVNLDLRADGPLDGADGTTYGAVQGFWQIPYANGNADVLTRLIPQGQFFGGTALLTTQWGPLELGPTVSVFGERSRADARFSIATPIGRPVPGEARKSAFGWSAVAGLTATLGLSDAVDLTLDAGLARGGIDLRERTQIARPLRPPVGTETRRENAIGGGTVTVELALRW